MTSSRPRPTSCGDAELRPAWSQGLWLGTETLAREVIAAGPGLAATWQVADGATTERAALVAGGAELIVHARNLDGRDDHLAPGEVFALALATRPTRIVNIIGTSWSGRGRDQREVADVAVTLALAGSAALATARDDTTVNTVAIGALPGGSLPPSAPISGTVDVADLLEPLAFFASPLNAYVTGQAVSVCGGEIAWTRAGL